MRKTAFFILLLFPLTLSAQQGKVVSIRDLEQLIDAPGNQIRVVNFWATWCAPCVKEMPLFEDLRQTHPEVTVTLVSMDLDLNPNPDKVNRFISHHDIHSEVLMLDAPDPNSWINKLDKTWSGALPATLVINPNTGERKFVEGEVTQEGLDQLIASVTSS